MKKRHSTRRQFLKLLGAGAILGPLRGCFSGARIQARTRPVERPYHQPSQTLTDRMVP